MKYQRDVKKRKGIISMGMWIALTTLVLSLSLLSLYVYWLALCSILSSFSLQVTSISISFFLSISFLSFFPMATLDVHISYTHTERELTVLNFILLLSSHVHVGCNLVVTVSRWYVGTSEPDPNRTYIHRMAIVELICEDAWKSWRNLYHWEVNPIVTPLLDYSTKLKASSGYVQSHLVHFFLYIQRYHQHAMDLLPLTYL